MSEYTQGVCHDGAAILKDGQPLKIEQILEALRERDTAMERIALLREERDDLATDLDAEQHHRLAVERDRDAVLTALSTLKQERDALAAHVEALKAAVEFCNEHHHFGAWSELLNSLDEQDSTSLARHNAALKATGIREAVDHILSMGCHTHLGIFRHDRYMYISTRELREHADALFQKAEAQQ